MTAGIIDVLIGLLKLGAIGAGIWLTGQIIYQLEERFRNEK